MDKKQYIREVADRSGTPGGIRRKIIADLEADYGRYAAQGLTHEEIVVQMGTPEELGQALYESHKAATSPVRPFVEYRSPRTLFGLPLVHIVLARRAEAERPRSAWQLPAAHGILAVGQRSRGVVAVGNLAAGLVAIGNIAVGPLALGNVALGALALGNLGVGILAAGNLAVGRLSVGSADSLAVTWFFLGALALALALYAVILRALRRWLRA